ncbi:MAG TPA: tetratricopeptide repeat protein [Ktedonobacterales bacterium]
MATPTRSFLRARVEAGTLLRSHRRARGLTQEALAERAGVSLGAVSYLERGLTHAPHRDTLRALAKALALSEEEAAALEQAARPAKAVEEQAAQENSTIFTLGGPQIPRPLTSLIGREHEAAAIAELLARKDTRLLTLTGPAGVGKTRLAVHAATQELDARLRSVIYVGLTPVQDPTRVLSAIAQALEIQGMGVLPMHDTLRIALADRDLLLVLDNFEQVTSAAHDIVDLLVACPGVTALVTSRIALNVRGERLFPVPPLPLPSETDLLDPANVEQCASVALFLERARAIRPDFAPSETSEWQQLADVCARLDGLPLAIELAAAQARHASLAELQRRLSGASPLNALSGGPQDLPDHQRVMRSAIAWSYSLLSPEERRVFRALSVFVGGATMQGVAEVVERDLATLVERLDSLVDQHLAYIAGHGDATRYAQLVTLRAYGLERLEEAGELAARRRHAQHYAALIDGVRERISRCEPASLALIGAEYENLRAALSWALEVADPETIWMGVHMCGALWFWWEVRGLWVEGLNWLERLIRIAPQAEDERARKALASVWTGMMALSYHLGRFERAYEAGEHALALQRQLSDKEDLAAAFNNQGIVAAGVRRYESAEDYFRKSLELYEALGHPVEECKPLMSWGGVKRDLRQYPEALALYQKSLSLAKQTDEHGEARANLWDDIGDIYILLGEPIKAIGALRRAEEIFQQLDASLGVALCAHDRGRARLAQGQLVEAAGQLLRAITIRERFGDIAGAARSRVHLAGVRLAQSDLKGAADLLVATLQSWGTLQRAEALWAAIESAAALGCASGRFELATSLYAAAIRQRDACWDIIDPYELKRRTRDLATLQAGLGEESFATVFARSQALSLDEVLDLAFGLFDDTSM